MERRHVVGCGPARTESDVDDPILTGIAVASFVAFGTLLVLFGANAAEISRALSLDYADLGLLGSMLSLGLGLGILGAGPLADRLPRRALFVSSCGVVLGATLLLGPETSYRELLVLMVAIGFGAGFYETVLNALIIEAFGEDAGRRLLFIHSGAPLAACIVPILVDGARVGLGTEWYTTFRIAGLIHVPLVLAAFFVPMDARRVEPGNEGHLDRSQDSDPVRPAERGSDRLALISICIATFAYVGVESAVTIFIADHVLIDLGFGSARAAATISAFWGGLLAGRLGAGLSPRSPAAGTVALLSLAGAALVLASGLGWIRVPELAIGGAGLVLGGVFPILIGLAGTARPSSAGMAVGLAGGMGSLGGFIVPWCTGRLARGLGLPVAIAALSGWLLLLVAAALAARSRRGVVS